MAEQFGIRLSVSVSDLLASVNRAIDEINRSPALKTIKIKADTGELFSAISKIKTELQSITGKSATPGVNLNNLKTNEQSASNTIIDTSRLAAIQSEFGKTAEIVKTLKNAIVEFKAEYMGITGDNIKALREQVQGLTADFANASQKNVGNNLASQTQNAVKALQEQQKVGENAVKSVKAAGEQTVNAESKNASVIRSTNELLKVRTKIYEESKRVLQSVSQGNSSRKVTENYINGSLSSTIMVEDLEKQRKQLEQNYAKAVEFETRLKNIKGLYEGVGAKQPIHNTNRLKELNSLYKQIEGSIRAIKTSSSDTMSGLKTDTKSQIDQLKSLVLSYQRLESSGTSLRKKDIATIKSQQASGIEEFTQKIIKSNVSLDEFKSKITGLKISLSKVVDSEDLVRFLNKFDVLKSQFDAVNEKAKTTANISKQIEKGIDSLTKISNNPTLYRNRSYNESGYNSLISSVDTLKAKYEELQNSLKKDSSVKNINRVREELNGLNERLKEAGRSAAALRTNLGNTKIDENLIKKVAQTQGLIADIIRKNPRAMSQVNTMSGSGLTFAQEFGQLRDELSKFPASVDSVNAKVRTLQANIKSLGYEGNTLLGEMKDKMIKFVKWTGMALLVTKVRMYIRDLFTTVYELDTELVDLRKTFDGTAEELEDFYFDSNKLAKQMGVTTKEIIQQGSAWSRLGYNSNETMKTMAEMSSMFAAISPGMSVDDAQNGLVSIMKAFDIDPENVLDEILSKVNIVGNTAVTSNDEIVDMLQRSSSAMKEANNTLEETIALETAAVEITRDAASVGTAFKTISMRIRGYDEETEEYIGGVEELSGAIADLTKTASNPGGISLFTDENKTTYKSTYELLKDISEIYDELTDKQQAQLLEALAGKRQGQIVAATIDNFAAAEEALRNMQNSAGSAEEEMEIIRDSAEYAMNALKETFTSLAQHSIDRGGLKELINAGTKILEIVDGVVSQIGLIPALLSSIFGIIAAKKNVSNNFLNFTADNGKLGINFLGAQVGKGWSERRQALKLEAAEYKNVINDLYNEMLNGTQASEKFKNAYNSAMNSGNAAIRNLAENTRAGTATINDMNTAANSLNSTLKITQVLANIANAAFSMLVSAGISMVINAAINSLNSAIKSYDNNIDKLKDLSESVKNLENDYNDLNDQLEESKQKLRELEKIPNPTLFDKAEIENIKEANKYLELQIKLKQIEIEQEKYEQVEQAKELRKDAELYRSGYEYIADKWADKDVGTVEKLISVLVPGWATIEAGISDVADLINGNTWSQQLHLLSKTEKALEKFNKAKEELNSVDINENSEKEIQKIQKQFDSAKEKLDENIVKLKSRYSEWQMELQALELDPENNAERINELKRVIEIADRIIKYEQEYKNILDIYNDVKFSDVKAELEELAEAGELTAEKLKNATDKDIDGIEEFKEALSSIGINDYEEVVQAIIDKVEDLKEPVDEATQSIYNFVDSLDELYEKVDDVVDKQGKLAEAFKKIGLGGGLTSEEAYDLIKAVPEIAKYLDEYEGKFSISQEGFREANKELYKEIQNGVSLDLVNLKNQKALLYEIQSVYNEQAEFVKEHGRILAPLQNEYNALVKQYRDKYGVLSDSELGENIEETIAGLENESESLSAIHTLINDIFDEQGLVVDAINQGFENGKDKINSFNNDIEMIDSAIKALGENSLLSYDEMNALVEISPELQGSFEQQEHGYSIAISALEELRKQSYETRNSYIDDLISQAEAEMQAAKEIKKANEEKCGYINEYGQYVAGTLSGIENAVEKMAAEEQVSIANAQIEALAQIIEKLKGLRGEITYEETEQDNDSLADEMQRRIEYYNTILSAIEAVKNKYTEAIDVEIETLQEGKDALKEANDERQREIDLIEARNNLENAKKRKVWVYNDADGFKQVQDEDALREAEEQYRDAIQDIQEAEIDKQIDALEKKKENIEKQVEDLTELESEIEESKTIAQALSALGLSDEKDLLNLSESVKTGIKEGLTEAILAKEKEDNKDNDQYISVTADDILKHLGAKVSTEDIAGLDNITQSIFDNAAKSFAQSLKEYTDSNINNVVNNNSGTVISPTFNINGVTDPQEVAKVVNTEMTNLFTKLSNSIK